MSDEEFYIQITKIFLGFVVGICVIAGLWHINEHLKELIALYGKGV